MNYETAIKWIEKYKRRTEFDRKCGVIYRDEDVAYLEGKIAAFQETLWLLKQLNQKVAA